MTDDPSLPRRAPSLVAVQLLVLLLLAVRLWIQIFAEADGDEAYYWLWGQHLGLSYFDHPPLHAWLQRAMGIFFGWNVIGLRVLTWVTLAGTVVIFWSWSHRLTPDDQRATFWYLTAIYLASPVFYLMTLAALNDHLMLFLCLASAHFFLRFVEDYDAGRSRRRYLYAGAILLGLAVLTKYTAAVYGLGVGIFFLIHRPLRPLLTSPHLWLAGALSLSLQAPVVWWNITESFATFRFHFDTRWQGGMGFSMETALQTVPRFLLWSLLSLSPFLVAPMARSLLTEPTSPFALRLRFLAGPTFLVSSLFMLVWSAAVVIAFYWNILAYLLVFPLAVAHIGRRWQFWLHAGFGVLAAILLLVNTTQLPLATLFGAFDRASAFNFGWVRLASEVRALHAQHPDAFLATTRYNSASQLGFALQNPTVTAIRPEIDQFDYWFDSAGHAGRNALVLADDEIGIADVEPHFDRLSKLRDIAISRFNQPLLNYQIYLAEGFRP
jgi:4-amino-4-deoxy-L-arabinose transferase-like glycosyltransferase